VDVDNDDAEAFSRDTYIYARVEESSGYGCESYDPSLLPNEILGLQEYRGRDKPKPRMRKLAHELTSENVAVNKAAGEALLSSAFTLTTVARDGHCTFHVPRTSTTVLW
jgi:hypothetical protein